jgi:hypothetical protein
MQARPNGSGAKANQAVAQHAAACRSCCPPLQAWDREACLKQLVCAVLLVMQGVVLSMYRGQVAIATAQLLAAVLQQQQLRSHDGG